MFKKALKDKPVNMKINSFVKINMNFVFNLKLINIDFLFKDRLKCKTNMFTKMD